MWSRPFSTVKSLAGILVLGITQPSIEAVEVSAVKELDHRAFRADRLGVLATSHAETDEKGRRRTEDTELKQHGLPQIEKRGTGHGVR